MRIRRHSEPGHLRKPGDLGGVAWFYIGGM